jgi:predicted HD superfamily hydrolase involved in NAD metabolism
MNNKYNFDLIRDRLQKSLSNKRYIHTLGVEKTAVLIAERYNVGIEKVRVSALLHDCAKDISNNQKLEICKKYNIEVNKQENDNPDLLHAKVGAIIAKTIYNIDDEEILNAIIYHTTGRPNMSILEKIIYVSDYIEPGRTRAPHLKEIRALVNQDLDKALLFILEDTINYLQENNSYIVPITKDAYIYYKQIIINR